ncbi:hypothetical protein C6N40_12930 [Arenimonas caeni]|uniref:DNA2/NAM7 helicase-like C-terminal domain-containing protein n=1 Tax=Arenimonas caeni TaxID=2058085 RepID=A0A2P6M5Z0_9GAMM|nr:hypothetical protein C6N40_12930 [Arenimonas caeni]
MIRFTMVDAIGMRTTRSTNEAEADFILDRLLELVELPSPPTVGVITPFREQQTLLSKKLFNHARARDFEDKLRLKVMTVDSCQGEERQQIFYSMVATRGQDALNYIFPVSLDGAVDAVEDKLKVQRLNVGFSRAQESIWIVHSMPLDEFRGGIGHALRYYRKLPRQAHNAKVELSSYCWRTSAGVRSPRESWGRSSLYSSIHHHAASRTSSRRRNRYWSSTSSRNVRLNRSM